MEFSCVSDVKLCFYVSQDLLQIRSYVYAEEPNIDIHNFIGTFTRVSATITVLLLLRTNKFKVIISQYIVKFHFPNGGIFKFPILNTMRSIRKRQSQRPVFWCLCMLDITQQGSRICSLKNISKL